MKTYKTILVLLSISVLFGGCYNQPEPEIRTVYKTKEVKVPVKCKVPKIDCNFKGEGFDPTIRLLECIQLQKRALEACAK